MHDVRLEEVAKKQLSDLFEALDIKTNFLRTDRST